MPLSRYQIRNEYSLADPELYRAADKDDPEALLEGVAMAGLVGVLRQLGDLAEFAAEIFHDLHEEVMATAARGHGLMVRVQQLEVEFPSIEKAFLSQTNHSQFISNPGVEWHPNLHADQNLITQGDLPRFIMDSYEESRGPPRLFLLDKFDVAGAGACLKRYTDPSFYKVDTTSNGRINADVQRERKARKTKKKGSRWRNGETPEVLPTSHVKLQQLLLEERIENGVGDPARLVKLKRRSNGSPFNSKRGKSYMEKIISTPLPEDKLVHEISVASAGLMLPSNITTESGIEMAEISEENSVEMNSSKDDFANEKEIEVYDERKVDANGDNYQYDDIGSEIDNYVDALATMDSEIETDTEIKAKSNAGFFNIDKQCVDFNANEEQLQAQISDSQSVGNFSASDDGNSLSKKGVSSFSCSDSASTSAENTLANNFPSNEHFEHGVNNMSSSSMTSDEEIAVTQTCHTDSAPTEFPVEEGAVSVRVLLEEQDSDDQLDSGSGKAEENAKHVDGILPFRSKLSDVPLQTNDDFANPVPNIDQSVDNVDKKESSVLSGELEIPFEIESREVMQESLVQTEDGASTNSVTSVAEEPPCVPILSEFETCCSDIISDGIIAATYVAPSVEKIEEVNLSTAENTPDAREPHFSETADDVKETAIYVGPSGEKTVEVNFCKDENTPDAREPHTSEIADDVKETEIVEPETLVEVVAVPKEDDSYSQSAHFTDLQEECISTIVKESDQKGLEVGETCAEQNDKEPGTLEQDNQQAAAAPQDTNSVQLSSDYSSSDLLKDVPDGQSDLVISDYTPAPTQTADAEKTLHLDDVIAVPLYSGNNGPDSDSKSPQLNYLIEDAQDTLYSPAHSFVEQDVNIQPIQNLDSFAQSENIQSPKHFDQETPVDAKQKVELQADELDRESALELEQKQPPLNQTDKQRCFDASPQSSAADRPSESPATELLTQLASHKFEFSEQTKKEPLPLAFPVFGLVPVVSEINLEEMPPLPPLPPVQWRMGKTSLTSNRAANYRNIDHFPQMFPSNPFEPHAAAEYGNSQTIINTVHSSPISLPVQTMPNVNSEYHAHPVNPFLEVHETYEERPQDSSLAEQVMMNPCANPLSTPATSSNTYSAHASGDPHEQVIPPLHQLPQEENSEDKKIEVLKVEDEKHQLPQEENTEEKKIQLLKVEEEQHQLPEENKSEDEKIQVLNIEDEQHQLPQEENTEEKKIQVLKVEEEQHQLPEENKSEDKKIQVLNIEDEQHQLSQEKDSVDKNNQVLNIEDEQPQYVPMIPEGGFMWSSSAAPFAPPVQDGIPNGNRPLKLMRPRSPLIDAVAAHDKSKLRKVTERVQPRIQNVDERDSLLEQIRTKSFNLKPSVATRPSIQGPKTNLRVAAILEKANAIRQAFAGSDEDDDADSWSSD